MSSAFCISAFAQNIETVTNEQVMTAWQNSARLSSYTQDVTAASGQTVTPLSDGSFYKAVVNLDGRETNSADNSVNFFQFGLTHTNDHAVASQTPALINNFQLGRSHDNYFISGGDITPNFSSLSSSLGVRGIMGQKLYGETLVTVFGGTVAETWEALTTTVIRSQFLRDVFGAKIENNLTEELQIYLTAQAGSDRSGSLNNSTLLATANATQLQSTTLGFVYTQSQYKLTGETAVSSSKQETLNDRSGPATIVDAEWSDKVFSVKLGYHDISADYASLSAKAPAGIKESFLSADWIAQSWLKLGGEIRNSKNLILVTETSSQNLRAKIGFGSEQPAWSLNLDQSDSKTTDAALVGKNELSSAALNYDTTDWKGGLTYKLGKVVNEAAPNDDAKLTGWIFALSKNFSDTIPSASATWTVNAGANLSSQQQQYLFGTNTLTTNRSVNFSGKHQQWGTLNFSLSDGAITRPNLTDLTTHSRQADISRDFTKKDTAKIFWRNTQNNTEDAALSFEEQSVGVDYSHIF